MLAGQAEKAQYFQNSRLREGQGMTTGSQATILMKPFCKKHEKELSGPQIPRALSPTPPLIDTGAQSPSQGSWCTVPHVQLSFQPLEPSVELLPPPGRWLTPTLQPP